MKRRIYIVVSLSLLLLGSIGTAQFSKAQQSAPPETNSVPVTTAQTFEKDVLQSSKPVLVDFCATWCSPCKKMEPIINDISLRYAGKIKVFRLDIDDDEDVADYFKIDAVPTIKLFYGGHPVKTTIGLVSAEKVFSAVDDVINKANISKTAANPGQSTQ